MTEHLNSRQVSVLVVDDDERICRTICRYLEKEGFSSAQAHTHAEAVLALEKNRPNVVLLDLNIPGSHGFAIAKDIGVSNNMGIIFITGSDDSVNKIVGLELGADDYMQKPLDFRELLARIRSIVRRLSLSNEAGDNSQAKAKNKARFGPWVLNLLSQELRHDAGDTRSLTSFEFLILATLVQSENRVLSRDQLMDSIADREWNPIDRSVDVLIAKIRKKLKVTEEDPQFIKTMRSQGYMFAAPVSWS